VKEKDARRNVTESMLSLERKIGTAQPERMRKRRRCVEKKGGKLVRSTQWSEALWVGRDALYIWRTYLFPFEAAISACAGNPGLINGESAQRCRSEWSASEWAAAC
jgi:hypothetical protein